MAIDYGIDVYAITDHDPGVALVTGKRAVAQALARRLGTPRGGLFYDPEYGFDLRMFANSSFSSALQFQVQAGIEAEAVKDDRVISCASTVVYDSALETLRVTIEAISDFGPFRLVLDVSAVTVTVLEVP